MPTKSCRDAFRFACRYRAGTARSVTRPGRPRRQKNLENPETLRPSPTLFGCMASEANPDAQIESDRKAPVPEQGGLSDEEIVERVRSGEVELFELLMRRYNQRLYRVARAVLRDDGEAEDVTQEAWVRAFTHLDQFAGRAKFATWLTRIAL